MERPIVMHDSVIDDKHTIIVCDYCHTKCSECEHRFYCYTIGTVFATKGEMSSAIDKLYR